MTHLQPRQINQKCLSFLRLKTTSVSLLEPEAHFQDLGRTRIIGCLRAPNLHLRVSPEVAKSHDVGVDDFLGVGTCIVFPYNDDCAKLRGLRRKDFRHYPGTSTAGLFYNLRTIDQDNPKEIFITESERDCLMMVSHGFPAISVSSATACINSDGSVKFKPEHLEELRRRKVFIAVDQDEDGKECAAALQKALSQAKVLTWHYGGKESIRKIWASFTKAIP